MNHIVIIGFMGSGKTRVGKRLSQEYKLPFVDVDKVIVKRMGMSVKDIFEKFGEPYYRALETMTIKELTKDTERKVISLGAGLPMQEQNQKIIPQLGKVVYIRGSLSTLKKRLEDTNNPLMQEENREEKLKKLLKQRDPVYEKFANVVVVTGVQPVDGLIREIMGKLEELEEEEKKN
ncbi:MAG: shikimate kinase [Blautia sp.]|nr:shikimate kinase [Blautia sp.]